MNEQETGPKNLSRRDLLRQGGSFLAALTAGSWLQMPDAEARAKKLTDLAELFLTECRAGLERMPPIVVEHLTAEDAMGPDPYWDREDQINPDSAVVREQLKNGTLYHLDFFTSGRAHLGELTGTPQDAADTKGRERQGTYSISPIIEQSILSTRFVDCMGALFSGIDRKTGRRVAFKIHVDPTAVLYRHAKPFAAHYEQRLSEFVQQVRPETVSYGFFGGTFYEKPIGRLPNRSAPRDTLHAEHYIRLLLLLGEGALAKIPGKMPVVLAGPIVYPGSGANSRWDPDKGENGTLTIITRDRSPEGVRWCDLHSYFAYLAAETKKKQRSLAEILQEVERKQK